MPKRKTSAETGNARNAVALSLTPAANARVNEFCERTGISKTVMMSRLVDWFSAAPSAFQQMIAGTVPEGYRRDFSRDAHEYIDAFVTDGFWIKVDESSRSLVAPPRPDDEGEPFSIDPGRGARTRQAAKPKQ